MKKLCLIILASVAITSCGRGKENRTKKVIVEEKASFGDVEQDQDSDTSATGSKSEVEFLPLKGSSMRFLDARALTQMYSRVFSMSDVGYRFCRNDAPRTVSFCFDSIFSHQERVHMGTFDIFNPNGQRGTSNLNKTKSMTLNYLRSLRAGLSRECRALVETELDNMSKGDVSKNVLVAGDIPTPAVLEGFMKRIMGVHGFDIKVDANAGAYIEAFKASIGSQMDQVKARKDAYIAVCVAVAADPQIVLY